MLCFDMKTEHTTVEEQVEYGLDAIDPARKVEVSLRDLLFVHNTLGEFVRFFHQPMHFETLKDVEDFIEDGFQGALRLLWESYYERFNYRDIFPIDIIDEIDEGKLENPKPPYYFEPKLRGHSLDDTIDLDV